MEHTIGYTQEQYDALNALASKLQWQVDSLPTTHTDNNRIISTITEVLTEAIDNTLIDGETASTLFDNFMNKFNFGYNNPFNTWIVTVDFDGNSVDVEDIEADDEWDAISEAKSRISINIDTVRYTVDIEGDTSYTVREDGYGFDIDTDIIMDNSIEFTAKRKFE